MESDKVELIADTDRKQVADRTMNRSFIDYYPGWFLSLCKRVGRNEFLGRQFNKALHT